MRLMQSTAQIPGCLECFAGVPDESVSELSQCLPSSQPERQAVRLVLVAVEPKTRCNAALQDILFTHLTE